MTKSKTAQRSESFRKKRADTLVGTIEKMYGKDLGVRSDMKLGTLLEKTGYESLTQLIKDV